MAASPSSPMTGSMLGFGTAVLWIFDETKEGLARVSLPAKVLGLCFLGCLLTPYFGLELLTFLSKADHPFDHGEIVEFQAASLNQYATGILVILMAFICNERVYGLYADYFTPGMNELL